MGYGMFEGNYGTQGDRLRDLRSTYLEEMPHTLTTLPYLTVPTNQLRYPTKALSTSAQVEMLPTLLKRIYPKQQAISSSISSTLRLRRQASGTCRLTSPIGGFRWLRPGVSRLVQGTRTQVFYLRCFLDVSASQLSRCLASSAWLHLRISGAIGPTLRSDYQATHDHHETISS